MERRNIAILGSTGSIGRNTLRVVARFPKKFKVVGLTGYANHKLLEQQMRQFRPLYVAANTQAVHYLQRQKKNGAVKILDVTTGAEEIACLKNVDCVVIAMHGSAALKPFWAAVRCGKTVAPANKEAIVIAGDILMREAKRHDAKIIPIDSEQSAIFQCLEGQDRRHVNKIYLTASGGALLNVPASRFNGLSVQQILNHPRWKMGDRITVDSATLLNKGLELLEAKHLFGLNLADIKVLIHPEAIIHSMVEFTDGAILAQLGVTDMRLPIQYALTYPQRFDTGLTRIDFMRLKSLTFRSPDFRKFPFLALALSVGQQGGTLPGVLNAADEVAVDAFLRKRIRFTKIYPTVETVVARHRVIVNPTLQQILDADRWARERAHALIKE